MDPLNISWRQKILEEPLQIVKRKIGIKIVSFRAMQCLEKLPNVWIVIGIFPLMLQSGSRLLNQAMSVTDDASAKPSKLTPVSIN